MNDKKIKTLAKILLVVTILYNLCFVVFTFGNFDPSSEFTVEITEKAVQLDDDMADEHPPGYCEVDEDCVFAELECKDNICQFRER